MGKTLYTAYFVDDKVALEKQFPTDKPKKYYDHCTIAWHPSKVEACTGIGKKRRLHIIGRLKTGKVDVLVVERNRHDYKKGPNGRILHITLGTAIDIPPVASNDELAAYFGGTLTDCYYEELDEYVDTTIGKQVVRDGKAKRVFCNEQEDSYMSNGESAHDSKERTYPNPIHNLVTYTRMN